MAIEIFKLFGSILIDNEKANESIKKTDEKAEGLGTKLLKGIGTAAKWGAGIAVAAGTGAVALAKVALSAADTASEIDRLSQTTGMTTDEFQRWDGVMKKYGYSMEQASGDLAALGEKAMDAAAGAGEGAELFGKLGVVVTDNQGKLRSQQDIFNDTITALQGMENITERNAIASALLSTTGEELVPILNMTNEELEEMKSQSNVIDEEQINQAREFKNSWENIKNTFQGLITEIGISVMPTIQVLFDFINDNMPIIQSIFDGVFKAIEWGVTLVGGYLNEFFTFLTNALNDSGITWELVWTKCQNIFNTYMEYIKFLWDSLGQPVFELIVDMIGWVKDIFMEYWPMISDFFKQFVDDAKKLWENNLKPMLTAIGDFIKNILSPAFEFVFKNIISPIVGACFKGIIDLWNNSLKPIFQGICDFLTGVFTGNWRKAFQGISDIVGGIFGGMVSLVKTPINAIIGIINKFIGGLNKLKIPEWIPGIGGMGVNIPQIPMLAKGTNYFKGGMAIVGEQGPELVTMPKGSKVTPADKTADILGQGSTFIIQSVLDGRVIAETIATYSDLVNGKRLNLSSRGVLV